MKLKELEAQWEIRQKEEFYELHDSELLNDFAKKYMPKLLAVAIASQEMVDSVIKHGWAEPMLGSVISALQKLEGKSESEG